MYGSNFWIVTRRPRSTSSRPIDAAAMPFPRDDTTPPMMKMYLVGCRLCSLIARLSSCVLFTSQLLLRPLRVSECVHATFGIRDDADSDRQSRVQRPELLQPLDPLERRFRQRPPPEKNVRPVRVQPDVTQVRLLQQRVRRRIPVPQMRDCAPGKIERGAIRSPRHLYYPGIPPRFQCPHGRGNGPNVESASDLLDRRRHMRFLNKWLVPLHVYDDIESNIRRPRDHLADPLRSGLVCVSRHLDFRSPVAARSRDLLRIGRDHHAVHDLELRDATPDPLEERAPSDRMEWLSGQPLRSEPGGDHGQSSSVSHRS